MCVLTDIGPLLGGRIHSQLEKEVVPSLDTALRMAGGNALTHIVAQNYVEVQGLKYCLLVLILIGYIFISKFKDGSI